jgi:hypothetical protein
MRRQSIYSICGCNLLQFRTKFSVLWFSHKLHIGKIFLNYINFRTEFQRRRMSNVKPITWLKFIDNGKHENTSDRCSRPWKMWDLIYIFISISVTAIYYLYFIHRPYVLQPPCFKGCFLPRHQVKPTQLVPVDWAILYRWLENRGTMDKIQIIDRSNTAPSSNTFGVEYRLVYDENSL